MKVPRPLKLDDKQARKLLFPRLQCKDVFGILNSNTMAKFLAIAGEQRKRFRGVVPIKISGNYNLFRQLFGLWRSTRRANMDKIPHKNPKQFWQKQAEISQVDQLLYITGTAVRQMDKKRRVPLAEATARLQGPDLYIDIATSNLYANYTVGKNGTIIPAGKSIGAINRSTLVELQAMREYQLQVLEFRKPDGEFAVDSTALFFWLLEHKPTLIELANSCAEEIDKILEEMMQSKGSLPPP